MMHWNHHNWRSGLVVLAAACLSACASTSPINGTPGQPAQAAELTLYPITGTPGSQLTISGERFPVMTSIQIRISVISDNRKGAVIADVKSDNAGVFSISTILPVYWSNGERIIEPNLVVQASTANNAVQAIASFRNTLSLGSEARNADVAVPTAATQSMKPTPSILLTPTVGGINTQVSVQAFHFPADRPLQLQIGIQGNDVDSMIYGTGQTDEMGASVIILAIPERWSDGHSLVEPVLEVVVSTADHSASAKAPLSVTNHASTTKVTPVVSVSTTTSIATSHVLTRSSNSTFITTTERANIDPIQSAVYFLDALLRDPTGESTVSYLSQRLRSEINKDWVLPTGLGIQPGYTSFEVAMQSRDENKVVIQATLIYESGASTRIFTLVLEDSIWRIDNVIAGSR